MMKLVEVRTLDLDMDMTSMVSPCQRSLATSYYTQAASQSYGGNNRSLFPWLSAGSAAGEQHYRCAALP